MYRVRTAHEWIGRDGRTHAERGVRRVRQALNNKRGHGVLSPGGWQHLCNQPPTCNRAHTYSLHSLPHLALPVRLAQAEHTHVVVRHSRQRLGELGNEAGCTAGELAQVRPVVTHRLDLHHKLHDQAAVQALLLVVLLLLWWW